MRRTSLIFGLCMVTVLALAATPAAAIDCQNLPTSAGAVSPDTLAACGGMSGASRPQLDPTDQAISPEGIGATCSEMTLNNPAATSTFGGIDFRPACDFAGSDFSQLYCATFANPATISTVSATDCTETTVGSCTLDAGHSPSGMAWDDSTGTMYLSSTDIVTSTLYTVDLGTGACTRVGGMGADSPGNIAIAVDSSTALGGGGQMFGFDILNDSLQSIDKSTGTATTIGPLGFNANYAQGMDFDESDGTCYVFGFNGDLVIGELRTCNTSDGSTTLVGAIGPTGFEEWTGPGILAGGGGCVLNAQIPRNVGRGASLPVNLSITHRRPSAVDVPFTLRITDRRGRIVGGGQTAPISLVYGQSVSTSYALQAPMRPGIYKLTVSMSQMRGGTELTSIKFRVR